MICLYLFVGYRGGVWYRSGNLFSLFLNMYIRKFIEDVEKVSLWRKEIMFCVSVDR